MTSIAAISLHVDDLPFPASGFDETRNPTQLLFDVEQFLGIHRLTLNWSSGVSCGTVEESCPAAIPPNAFLALIDDITLVPIPEPSTLALLALSLVALAAGAPPRR